MSNFYFPTEILTEILLKLPVKSLIRFTIVCKSWQSLITSPTFISSHLSNTENHALVTRYDHHEHRYVFSLLKITETGLDSSSELEFPINLRISHRCNRVVGSCDGLVCLKNKLFGRNSLPIIIWNPSVRNHVVLPNPIINPKVPYIRVLGFGVSNHVYKVVSLVYNRKPENVPMQAEIFSFSSTTMGRWRSFTTFGISLQVRNLHQVFLKGVGVVHWLAFEGTNCSVLTFNVGDEVFGEVMLPDELSRADAWRLRHFVIGESLGVTNHVNGSCDVWMMKEYSVKESWTKLHRIDFSVGSIIDICRSGKAQWMLCGGALRECGLVAYNPKTRGIKTLGIYGIRGPLYMYNYVESLLLLRGYSGAADEDIDEDIAN